MRRHYNWDLVTKTKASFKEHLTLSGMCSICTMDGICEIGLKAKVGRTLFPEPFGTAQFGAEKRLPSLQDIQILPEIFGREVIFRRVSTFCKLGGFKVSFPASIAALGSTKVAHLRGKELAEGAAKAGIITVIGENIFPTYGEEGLKARIKPFLENYEKEGAVLVQGNVEDRKLGVLEKAIEFGAHGVELKFGQGAKQGLGGEIRFSSKEDAERYKKLGYTVIQRPDGSFERHSSPGSIEKEEVRKLLIRYSELGVPIWAKIGIGRGIVEFLELLSEMKREQGVKLEAVTVDGHGGGTGMSPWLVMNETSIPSPCLLSKRRNFNFDLLVAGGFADGISIAKALMLGAKGVAMGRAFLVAASVGKSNGIVKFVDALREELQMICAMLRIKSVDKLIGRRENLIALNDEAARLFGLLSEFS